uniref:Si:dkey-16i5.8 n=1 Tax=Kryptolebias marmoratus TaxID=37003 RepID=A0A3Q3BRY9_KRYMA
CAAAPCMSHGAVGRCRWSFWFAVVHDILGVFIMMVGVFGGLVVHDLFIYIGAIIIFLSLIWWVFWYSGNIDVPPEELEDDVDLIKRVAAPAAPRQASLFTDWASVVTPPSGGPCSATGSAWSRRVASLFLFVFERRKKTPNKTETTARDERFRSRFAQFGCCRSLDVRMNGKFVPMSPR